jgi:hypothetical protein
VVEVADVARRPRLFGWRGVVLVLVGVSLGALTIAPGVGLAAKFLTKQQVKKRYLGNTTIVTQAGNAPTNSAVPVTLNCPVGKQATGGGADGPGVFDGSTVTGVVVALESRPVASGTRSTGWYLELLGATSGGGTSVPYTASVVCSS